MDLKTFRFYTGKRPWTAENDFRKLINGPEELRRFAPTFDIIYVGLRDIPAERLEAAGPVGWVQRADASKPEFAAIVERAARAIEPLLTDEWRHLATFLTMLVTYRRPLEEWPELERALEQSVPEDVRRQEIQEMSKTMAEVWLEEGMEKGRMEGREEGREEGRIEGQLTALQETIADQGSAKFGAPTAACLAQLNAVSDIARLKRMVKAVLSAKNWDDLLLIS